MRDLTVCLWILVWVTLAFIIPGGVVLLGFGIAVFVRMFWPGAVLAALGGTTYWVCRARCGPDWDRELMGLIGLYAILADFLIIWYAIRVACDGFRL